MVTRFLVKFVRAILAILIVLGAQPVGVQALGAGSPSDSTEIEAFFNAYLAEQMLAYHIPGVVISVVKDGEGVFTKGYGYADIERRIPFDENTLLTTASLGKVFTAVGVLQLSERNVIDLHEDIRPYFTDFSINTRFEAPLTFAHLLTHTDGFETRTIGVAAVRESELKPLGEMLATYKPNQILPAGKYLTYGDYAANLAGYLTERISGVAFEQYMDKNIFVPLGMTHSTFDQHLTQVMRDNLATGYSFENGEYQAEPFLYVSYAPMGGLRTTASDMNRFMLTLLNAGEYQDKRILNAATVQSMFTQQFTQQAGMPGITYGLFEDFHNGQRALIRDGDGVGTRTRMVLLPEKNTAIFLSYNSGDSNLRLNLLGAYLDHFFPKGDSAPIPMDGHQKRAAMFTGSYRPLQADVSTFTKSLYFFSQLVEVTAKPDGTLAIQSTGMGDHSSVMGGFEGTTQWVEVSPLSFKRIDGNGVLAFMQDDAGNIVQMVSGQGYHSTFSKLGWYESQTFQAGFIGLAAFLLLAFGLAVFLFIPAGALIRKLRKQTTAPQPKAAIAALIWGGVVTQWLAMAVFQTVGVLYAINSVAGMPNFVWGITPEIINALNGVYLPVILSLSIPVLAIIAWGRGWWKPATRILFSAASIAVLMVIWWANYWNLIGFHL